MQTLMVAAMRSAFWALIFCSSCAWCKQPTSSAKQVYVVYMGGAAHEEAELTSAVNHEVLASVHDGSLDAARESIVYSYKHAFRGFSAKLTEEQAQRLASREDVVKVFKSEVRHLHTTRSWQFLGLPMSELGGIPHSSSHHKVIVGVFDTGIWPEAESFNDYKMPPVPKRWRGGCVAGENFTERMCNRKLIGAKYYLKGMEEQDGPMLSRSEGGNDIRSARDTHGHGTHTASTAAGRYKDLWARTAGLSRDLLGNDRRSAAFPFSYRPVTEQSLQSLPSLPLFLLQRPLFMNVMLLQGSQSPFHVLLALQQRCQLVFSALPSQNLTENPRTMQQRYQESSSRGRLP